MYITSILIPIDVESWTLTAIMNNAKQFYSNLPIYLVYLP